MKQTSAQVSTLPRQKTTATLLAFFLGWLGVHRFYLGQYGWGSAYLVLANTGIPFIAGIMEGVMLLIMPQEMFDERYNAWEKLQEEKKKRNPRVATAMMAFIFGPFGIHKFYLRKITWGLIYLIATLFGIYVCITVFKDAGILEKIRGLTYPYSPEAIAEVEKMADGLSRKLFMPSMILLISSLAGLVEGFILLRKKDESFEREFEP